MSTPISGQDPTVEAPPRVSGPLLATCLTVVLALSACSPPSEETPPLDAALFGRFEAFLAKNDQMDWEKAFEEAIADCMKPQGFEYTPELAVGAGVILDDAPLEGTPEFAAEYGYGFTDYPGRAEESAEIDRLLAERGTPQGDRVSAMSPAEKAAYDSALWGGDAAAGTEDVRDSVDPEDRGCRAIAEEKVGPDPASFLFTPEMEALQAAIGEIEIRVAEDPRLTTAHEQWVDCMVDAGLVGFTHPDDAPQSIVTEINTKFSRVADATLENPDYAALRQVELSTATADLACRAEIGYDAQQQKVRTALEADFVAQNQELIEQAVAQFEKVAGATSDS